MKRLNKENIQHNPLLSLVIDQINDNVGDEQRLILKLNQQGISDPNGFILYNDFQKPVTIIRQSAGRYNITCVDSFFEPGLLFDYQSTLPIEGDTVCKLILLFNDSNTICIMTTEDGTSVDNLLNHTIINIIQYNNCVALTPPPGIVTSLSYIQTPDVPGSVTLILTCNKTIDDLQSTYFILEQYDYENKVWIDRSNTYITGSYIESTLALIYNSITLSELDAFRLTILDSHAILFLDNTGVDAPFTITTSDLQRAELLQYTDMSFALILSFTKPVLSFTYTEPPFTINGNILVLDDENTVIGGNKLIIPLLVGVNVIPVLDLTWIYDNGVITFEDRNTFFPLVDTINVNYYPNVL